MTPKLQIESKAPSHTPKAGAVAAVVSPATLVGTWNNTNHATNDIVKIIIAAAGSGISVQVFGACTPSPCVWGSVSGIAYAANVSSSPAAAFSAQYKFSFAQYRHRPPPRTLSRPRNLHRVHRRQRPIESLHHRPNGKISL